MKQTKRNELITFTAAVLLIMLFGYAVLSKLAERELFVEQMKLAPLPIMQEFAPVLGWLIPMIMAVIVLLLWRERSRKTGLYASFVLLLAFEVYITAMLLSGKELPCTCGGLHAKLQWREQLWFNAFFMLVSLFPFFYEFLINRYHQKNIRHNKLWE